MRGGESPHGAGWRLAGLALGLLASVALQLQQAALSPAAVYAGIGAAALACLAVAWRVARPLAWLVAGAVLLGFAFTGARAVWQQGDALRPALEGVDLQVRGVVASLPQQNANGVRFRFEVESASLQGRPVEVPALLALGWYAGWHEDAARDGPQFALRAGQRWQFTVRLRQPHGNLNPHGYDLELSLFEQGVRATGYVRDAPAQLLDRAAGHPVERLRQAVRDRIQAKVTDPRAAGVLAALSVGDQSAIDREDWDLFRRTGIAHLVSISGLHVTMFAWLAGIAVAALWRRSSHAMLWLPAPLAARWGGLVAALAYAVFSGWGVPAQRTVWMLAAVTLLQAGGLRWPWPLVLLAAAVACIAIDPWALLQPGFWLSFAAVGLLMASGPASPAVVAHQGWRGRLHWLWSQVRDGVRTQAVATIGLAPLTLVFFQQISVVGFAANLVAIPLVTLVITPLALLGAVLSPLWLLGAWVVQWMCAGLAWLGAWPMAVLAIPVAPWWAQIAGLLGAALVMLPLPWRMRVASVALVVPLLLPPRDLPPTGHYELLAVDVGQGTALLLRTRGHLLLYDAGPMYSRDSDAGQRVLLPLLRARGDTRIDRLVLSHRDLDHVGGAAALLRGTAVDEVLSSLEDTHPLRAAMPRHTRCEAGQRWQWDGVHFEMLAPLPTQYERGTKSNAMSCVLKVTAADGASALLTGDIEREQELGLVDTHGERLRSQVLIAPHHGSKTSSSEPFLAAVQPRVVVFQAGYRNRFGHPAAPVTERYAQRGVAQVASPACGAWRWRSDEAQGRCQRQFDRRYWRYRDGDR